MPFPQSQVEWILANHARILRYACVPQFLAGAALFAFAHFTGRTDLHLLVRGARTQGKIVGFQRRQLHTHSSPSSTGMFGRIVYLPIVKFGVLDPHHRALGLKLDSWQVDDAAEHAGGPRAAMRVKLPALKA